MRVHLLRWADSPHGVFGTLTIPEFQCYTVERPWLNNQPRVSCIPAGLYKMRLGLYHNKYSSYEIIDVPDRTLIKIHVANLYLDLLGCIGLGRDLGYFQTGEATRKYWGVGPSTQTYEKFMSLMVDSSGRPLREAEIQIEWKQLGS